MWIGNWGDGERSAEIVDYLLKPARDAGLPLDIYGVRYPDAARTTLARIRRALSWLAGECRRAGRVREASRDRARAAPLLHEVLPGIPTIRVFEALACGFRWCPRRGTIASICSASAQDFLMVRDGAEMTRALRDLRTIRTLRETLVRARTRDHPQSATPALTESMSCCRSWSGMRARSAVLETAA